MDDLVVTAALVEIRAMTWIKKTERKVVECKDVDREQSEGNIYCLY